MFRKSGKLPTSNVLAILQQLFIEELPPLEESISMYVWLYIFYRLKGFCFISLSWKQLVLANIQKMKNTVSTLSKNWRILLYLFSFSKLEKCLIVARCCEHANFQKQIDIRRYCMYEALYILTVVVNTW